jgi:Na+-transporting methylmalonyl-CoA/oxaloacetate decarboxylase beta subunit
MGWNACKIGKVSQIFRQIGIYRDDKSILKGQVFMEKSANSVSVIGGADGPTSIFFKKNAKLTLKQKIQRAKK